MHDATFTVPEPHRLARAFLALTDDLVPEPARRSLFKAVAAIAAALVLAVAMPLTWMAPTARTSAKVGDQPAATLGNSKALLAAPDDEDADGDG